MIGNSENNPFSAFFTQYFNLVGRVWGMIVMIYGRRSENPMAWNERVPPQRSEGNDDGNVRSVSSTYRGE
jgi:hypothetical protein